MVGIAGPGDVGVGVEWAADRGAGGVGDDGAGFFGDEFRAQVVGVAAMADGRAASGDKRLDEWAKVGDEAVLAGGEVINLAAGAGVLVFEDGDFALIPRDDALAELFIERGEEIAATGEEAADRGKAVAKFWGS